MPNIFLLYMPPGNAEAMVHYQDTDSRTKSSFDRIATHVPSGVSRQLRQVFGEKPIAVWGSRSGPGNRATFGRMNEGDEVLILEGPIIRLLGRVASKTQSPALSRELWRNLRGG